LDQAEANGHLGYALADWTIVLVEPPVPRMRIFGPEPRRKSFQRDFFIFYIPLRIEKH
jgi:hypothetical protein